MNSSRKGKQKGKTARGGESLLDHPVMHDADLMALALCGAQQ